MNKRQKKKFKKKGGVKRYSSFRIDISAWLKPTIGHPSFEVVSTEKEFLERMGEPCIALNPLVK